MVSQFMKVLQVVQFSGNEIDLGSVMVHSGKVGGQTEADMDIHGSRVFIAFLFVGVFFDSKI